ncbi:uncharacterized protein DFL_000502 [Arthrobotrys flagrans]|uniref:Uncharacterized protein n=1 Tax=Arthrobotrys flagrans TaxID=97331 RepID=A0A437AEG8_ARTFL|nr:hypothetical protein DFL_000502 [Arthrobotrys flagrans]
MSPSFVRFVENNGPSHPKHGELEETFTTECSELLTLFAKKPATYQRMTRLIKILNEKVGTLNTEKEKLIAEEADIPTIGELIPGWVRPHPPPSIVASSERGGGEKPKRRMEQLVEEVRTVAAGRTNFTSPPVAGGPSVQVRATDTLAARGRHAFTSGCEPSVYGARDSGGSQGSNLWVYTPAMTEGDGGSFCRPSESEPVSIIDGYDDRRLRLSFPPLVPAVLLGTYPSAIPPRLMAMTSLRSRGL